ncbi:biotin transporter BioY [Haloarcula laminariae]|uniref:biotin transporter BioY n=1 Tax=Haloarcula laminariae TaxID=2961577 RepID=UPI0021C8B709|nr:biotin transporter BioY [Halomicroarcula laminariae]
MSETESVDLVGDEAVSNIALAAVLAALTAAFAYVSIPIPGLPAPVSFQVFGVYFAGLLLGPRWGGFSVGIYLLAGIAGAPVFSNGAAGLGYVLGPTGGYLVGFLLAAILIGALVHRGLDPKPLSDVSLSTQAGALVAGLVVIYAVGVPWLALSTGLPPVEAATVGAAVFLPGDAIKIAATLGLVKGGALVRQQSAAAA